MAQSQQTINTKSYVLRDTSVLQESLFTVSRYKDSLAARKNTKPCLEQRLVAEATIVRELQERGGAISSELIGVYAHRLFKTAVNKHAKGEADFAQNLGELAMALDLAPRRFREKCTRFVWMRGQWLSCIWYVVGRIFSVLRKRFTRAGGELVRVIPVDRDVQNRLKITD